MPTHLVNLDALIPREDFEEARSNPLQQHDLPKELRLSDLISSINRSAWRKPDFQRETAYWKPETVAEFIRNYVSGDLIPSVVLWRSPTTGDIFVIDGAHRLSTLLAWVEDDYGDRSHSRAFFEELIPPEQAEAAAKTRELVNAHVGSWAALNSAGERPDQFNKGDVLKARSAELIPFPVQWVIGGADKAEEAFYRINLQQVEIDPTELKMIKARKMASALAARAIMRAGGGHPYWVKFSESNRDMIRETAKSIYDVLFQPPLQPEPLNTLELPIAGRSYAGGDSLGLVFDLVLLANGLVTSKHDKAVTEDRKRTRKAKNRRKRGSRRQCDDRLSPHGQANCPSHFWQASKFSRFAPCGVFLWDNGTVPADDVSRNVWPCTQAGK